MFNQDYQKMFQFIQTPIVSKENNILLEPLSCIFRMSLLNYKDDGMKISIFNNSIQYHEKTFYQGLLRSYNGDTREDLHNLYNPFLKFSLKVNNITNTEARIEEHQEHYNPMKIIVDTSYNF